MLFEKLLELLATLAVALGGIAGLGTAADSADPPANDAALSVGLAQVDELAAIRAATDVSRSAAALAELEAVGPTDGLARAVEALTQASDSAPEQADDGLDTAMEAVTGCRPTMRRPVRRMRFLRDLQPTCVAGSRKRLVGPAA